MREQEDAEIGDQHGHQHRQYPGILGVTDGGDHRTGEGEGNDEQGDSRKGAGAEQGVASAHNAGFEAARIIHRTIPSEKEFASVLAVDLDGDPGRPLGDINLGDADALAGIITDLNPHVLIIHGDFGGLRLHGRVPQAITRAVTSSSPPPTSLPAPSSWVSRLSGRFIVFDGPDGSGKSTQFARFAEWCRTGGVDVVEVREPGGTAIGEQIRTVLLSPANSEMDLFSEMLLYMASRAQLLAERIRPALAKGQFVLADRFVSSTLAYQGAGGGMTREAIMAVAAIAVGETWPDLTVIFDVDEATAAKRLVGGSAKKRRPAADELGLFADRMESQDAEYRRRVREGYLDQARREPAKYLIIDGSKDADTVFGALIEGLRRILGG